MSVLQKIHEMSLLYPERIAYQVDEETLTYGELWKQSDLVAAFLIQNKIAAQAPIAVYGHMSPQQIIAFLGVVKAGHPYIPLDTSIPDERIQHILSASNAAMLLNTEKINIKRSLPTYEVNSVLELSDLSSKTISQSNWVEGEEIFYIIYTSGSTGNPKGVQITANNLEEFVMWLEDHAQLQDGVYLNQAPYSFDLSVMDLYPALTKGRSLYALTKTEIEQPAMLFESLQRSNVNVWTSTPSFVKICMMNPLWNEEMMPSINKFLFCGEVLPHELASRLQERFPQAQIINLYGPTETTVAVTAVEVTKSLLEVFNVLPIAKADSDRLILLDEAGDIVSEGEKGQLVITGPTVSKGYLGAPEQTDKVFKLWRDEDVYYTGDVGYYQNGYIFYSGRSDFQVKLHGYRLEIEEIEKKIGSLNEVSGCIVQPVKVQEEVVSLTAFVVLTQKTDEKPFQKTKRLKSALSEVVPSYMVPKKFIYVDQLPLNANGKVDRKRLAVEVTI
ncbi:D-alanine--poly(phosphoribitol) ligase subunit DltA [Rummeliibacillus pycnus]|uniref:D-alanine--poly(phosphoribitol) ligase subunit DltA n=1 Tax=Rummeliibacillus pycnus TaxID=101070 RepID=UPI003D2AAD5A